MFIFLKISSDSEATEDLTSHGEEDDITVVGSVVNQEVGSSTKATSHIDGDDAPTVI